MLIKYTRYNQCFYWYVRKNNRYGSIKQPSSPSLVGKWRIRQQFLPYSSRAWVTYTSEHLSSLYRFLYPFPSFFFSLSTVIYWFRSNSSKISSTFVNRFKVFLFPYVKPFNLTPLLESQRLFVRSTTKVNTDSTDTSSVSESREDPYGGLEGRLVVA